MANTSLTCSEWKQIISELKKEDIILQIIQIVYESDNHRLNAGMIAELLGYSSHLPLNRVVGALGHNIYDMHKLTNCPVRDDGTKRWWNIVFDGEDVYENGKLKCYWIIKNEMLDAINELGLFQNYKHTKNIDDNLHEQVRIYKGISDFDGIERNSIVKIRCNQGRIRNIALSKYQKCELCGLQIPSLLIASHIKPWSISNPSEKTDIDNILLLCPNHDSLFDKHLISFDNNGRILINPNITGDEIKLLNINETQKIEVNEKRIKYLEIHRKEFLK